MADSILEVMAATSSECAEASIVDIARSWWPRVRDSDLEDEDLATVEDDICKCEFKDVMSIVVKYTFWQFFAHFDPWAICDNSLQ